ncbi:MAG: 1-phosphofructokinase family hexose kinase [Erysipelotrichaceae bacterium]|nr:1-phosphofructokinase family hexose kinase [Erysipelotrichaceae bacterium]MDY5252007.1 1-phosphofructokinase family hexose kinase [Erysipelotrichaceae bacterium]
MIYTCTINPSLDYYMEYAEPLTSKETNRSQLEFYEAGGKGINVSIVLNNMMVPSRAFGFLGGFTRHFFIELLQKYEYIQPSFTYIDGHTRINVKIRANGEETDLNAAGPYITPQNMETLRKKVERLDENDTFVFSGNCPEYILDDICSMIDELLVCNVRVILDTNATIINRCIANKPFLIRINIDDLQKIAGKTLKDEQAILQAMEECVAKGAQNIIVQLGDEGAIFVNKDGAYKSDAPQKDKIVNTVGSADSMVAGFVVNYNRSRDAVDSFKFANCCKAATTFSKGFGTREKINELYQAIQIQKLK